MSIVFTQKQASLGDGDEVVVSNDRNRKTTKLTPVSGKDSNHKARPFLTKDDGTIQANLREDLGECLLKQLKIMNMYLSLMTDVNIRESEVE